MSQQPGAARSGQAVGSAAAPDPPATDPAGATASERRAVAGPARSLTLAAGGIALVIYLLGFIGEVGFTDSLTGPLLVGGGLLAGTAALPGLRRMLVPAAVLIVTGTLLLLQLITTVDATATVVFALVLAFLQSGAVVAAVLVDAGVISVPVRRSARVPHAAPGYGGYPPGSGFAPPGYGQSGAGPYGDPARYGPPPGQQGYGRPGQYGYGMPGQGPQPAPPGQPGQGPQALSPWGGWGQQDPGRPPEADAGSARRGDQGAAPTPSVAASATARQPDPSETSTVYLAPDDDPQPPSENRSEPADGAEQHDRERPSDSSEALDSTRIFRPGEGPKP